MLVPITGSANCIGIWSVRPVVLITVNKPALVNGALTFGVVAVHVVVILVFGSTTTPRNSSPIIAVFAGTTIGSVSA
jgi:hypothetical protein